MSVEVYMIENTADNTFWTNLGFKKDHGNLYKDIKPAQHQIDKGKLSAFIGPGIGNVPANNIKISKFNLTRIE